MKRWMLLVLVTLAAAAALCLGASPGELAVGLASGVLAAWVWASVDVGRRRRDVRDRLRLLEGVYRVRPKGEPGGDLGTVRLRLVDMLLETYSEGRGSAGEWKGYVEMSESLPSRGSGIYSHSVVDGWGFHTVQVRGDDFFVLAEFVRAGKHERETNAYVWEREQSRPDESV